MAESTLTLSYADLAAEIGFALGYGRDSEKWSDEQSDEIDVYLQSGLRNFYHPPSVGGAEPHAWRFFRPTASLVTVADQGEYDAADDFGGLEGEFTFDPEEGWEPIRVVSEGDIRAMRQQDPPAGRPRFVCARPKAFDPSIGQRFEFVFDRDPDAVYTLGYTYYITPPLKLSADAPYPYGGEAHSETILASCLAVVEARATLKEKGPAYQDYMEKLATSIAADRRSLRPQFLGYNGDRSDLGSSYYRARTSGMVTVNGVIPA